MTEIPENPRGELKRGGARKGAGRPRTFAWAGAWVSIPYPRDEFHGKSSAEVRDEILRRLGWLR